MLAGEELKGGKEKMYKLKTLAIIFFAVVLIGGLYIQVLLDCLSELDSTVIYAYEEQPDPKTYAAGEMIIEEVQTEEKTCATQTPPPTRYTYLCDDDIDLIAAIVWLEARGEPFEGQQAVAEVVLNRMMSDDFPDTVKDVLYQQGQFQPAAYLDQAEPADEQYDAVEAALYGPNILPVDVVFFSTSGENDNVWGGIGGHVFCYKY